MSDINKIIENPDMTGPLQADRMLDLKGWNEQQARHTARQLGIEVTDEHLKVINYLRDYYLQHGPTKSGRLLAEILDERFADHGGSKYLYRLFPNGPVAQGMRIAGLPLPPYTEDQGFGSSI